ncbi:cell division protein FtsQ/DivIB [Xylanimonas oleitrophica]|nr:cell division protein FtsQ/DivIB [Xylanimonas oleitrophica]
MRRHRMWRAAGIWTATLAVAGGLGWVAFFSPVMALDPQEVTVTGQGTTVDVAQVQEVVARQAGVPLPRLDTVRLRDEVLGVGGVKDVRVARAWPDGLTVALVSREPAAAVPVEGGFVLVDLEGVQVGGLPEPPEGMPLVHVPLGEDDAPVLQAALHVVAGLPSHLAAEVTEVGAETRDDVRTRLASGQEVRWGDDSRMAYKVVVVERLRQADPEAGTYDVSSPDLPVTR